MAASDAYASGTSSAPAPAGLGSNPPSYRYRASENDPAPLPVPWWFVPSAADRYRELPLEEGDIIVSSGARMGTTWFTKLMVGLLYEYDDEGRLRDDAIANRGRYPGRFGQTYPEALYRNREEKERDPHGIFTRLPGAKQLSEKLFGDFVYEDLLNQPRPRMFVSHLYGLKYLPRELFDEEGDATREQHKDASGGGNGGRKGKGRLIVVVRNLKDTLVSLHHFRGTAIDGWLGNAHGIGSFRRFLKLEDCPNPLGSHWCFVRESAKAVEAVGNGRALVVHYESLVTNFSAQLRRINDFLGLAELTEAKAQAIEEACTFQSMMDSGMRTRINCRKGKIGGWKTEEGELGEEHWAEFDRFFNRALEGVEMAEPMRFFQQREVPGMPPLPLEECDLDTDPRKWPPYMLVTLREGMIVPDRCFLGGEASVSTATDPISPNSSLPSVNFEDANSDGTPRYHLFVAASCPQAASVCAARHLLGMEKLISMDVSDGQSGSGWTFLGGASCSPWKEAEEAPFWLHEAYQLFDPLCTTQIKVPVLWDTVSQRIVSNDPWEIIKLMSQNTKESTGNDALGVVAKARLFPEDMVDAIEAKHAYLENCLINATLTAGMDLLRRGDVDSARESLKKAALVLDGIDAKLGKNRFVLGDHVTAVDLSLATFLFIWDACYRELFKLKEVEGHKGSVITGDAYPNLKAYTREMYQLLKPTVNFASFRHDFRLARAIEFTRQSYLWNESEVEETDCVDGELPNLSELVASLEDPAGGRPSQKSAPRPPKPLYQGVRMPHFFREDSFQLFKDMDVQEDDIFVSSGVKMGTTWVTRMLTGLKDFDDEGNLKAGVDDTLPNRKFQCYPCYPESLPPTREVERRDIGQGKSVIKDFGDFTLDELMSQPSPRLISTHLFGKQFLPRKLFDQPDVQGDAGLVFNSSHNIVKGKGRLIVVVRNLKDTLVSLHHFRGVPEDGWYGNEHGPGSFRRWVDLEDCHNSYGSAFQWVKSSANAVDAIGPERALVIYYEALKSNFAAQLRRINAFLGLPRLSEAREQAITHACSAKSMKTTTPQGLLRNGVVRDWCNYLTDENWCEVDRTFNKVLNGVALAEPLRFYQQREVPGMPPLPLKECTLDTDPREWPPYMIFTLRDGMIVPDSHPSSAFNCISTAAASTQFKSTIRPGRFLRLDETGRDGSPRFHLFVAGACPVASSVAAARTLLGLEQMISMDVADGQSGGGWVYLNGASCLPWKEGEGPFWLYEAYQLADPFCTANISAPVLWDTATQTIVSNDAWEIMKLLSDAASDLGLCSCPKDVLVAIAKKGDNNNIPTLFPDSMKQDIDQMLTSTVQPLLDAIFGTGFDYIENGGIETQQVIEGRLKVFALLEKLEETLGCHRYLSGNAMTGVDVVLAFCLFQFDACYLDAFRLRRSEGYKGPILTANAYPKLKAYARDIYRLVKPTVHFESFRQLFQLRDAIEFTKQSYSCSEVAEKMVDDATQEELPDLHTIIAALECP